GLQMVIAVPVAGIRVEQRVRRDRSALCAAHQIPVGGAIPGDQVVDVGIVSADISIFFDAVSLSARNQAVAEQEVVIDGAVVMNPVADDVVIRSGVVAVVDSGATVAGATGRLDVMDVIPDNAGK